MGMFFDDRELFLGIVLGPTCGEKISCNCFLNNIF